MVSCLFEVEEPIKSKNNLGIVCSCNILDSSFMVRYFQ